MPGLSVRVPLGGKPAKGKGHVQRAAPYAEAGAERGKGSPSGPRATGSAPRVIGQAVTAQATARPGKGPAKSAGKGPSKAAAKGPARAASAEARRGCGDGASPDDGAQEGEDELGYLSVKFAGKDVPPAPSTSLYVSGLPPTIERSHLWKAFGDVGVTICQRGLKILEYGDASAAIVQVSSIEDAKRVIDRLNGSGVGALFPDLRPLNIKHEDRRLKVKFQGIGASPPESSSIYVTGVPATRAENLLALLGVTVKSCESIRENMVAAVQLATLADAKKVLARLHDRPVAEVVEEMMRRPLQQLRSGKGGSHAIVRVKYKGPGPCPAPCDTVSIVGATDGDLTLESLNDLLSTIEARAKGLKLQGAGSAIVQLESIEQATNVILAFDGCRTLFDGRELLRRQQAAEEQNFEERYWEAPHRPWEEAGPEPEKKRPRVAVATGQSQKAAAQSQKAAAQRQRAPQKPAPPLDTLQVDVVGTSPTVQLSVAGLPADFSEDAMRDMLPIGVTVVSLEMRHGAKGSRATLALSTEEDAFRCVDLLHGRKLVDVLPPAEPAEDEVMEDEGKDAKSQAMAEFQAMGDSGANARAVRVTLRGASRPEEVLMAGLPNTGGEEELLDDMFLSIGVKKVHMSIQADRTGKSSSAMVKLESAEQAKRVVEMFNGWEFPGE